MFDNGTRFTDKELLYFFLTSQPTVKFMEEYLENFGANEGTGASIRSSVFNSLGDAPILFEDTEPSCPNCDFGCALCQFTGVYKE